MSAFCRSAWPRFVWRVTPARMRLVAGRLLPGLGPAKRVEA
jgi:hypothetical protein